MEIALNSSVVAPSSSSATKTSTSALNGFLPAQVASQGWVHSSNAFAAGGFKNEHASNSSSSLALLAALSLKGALNGINNNNYQQQLGFVSNQAVASATPTSCKTFSFSSAGLTAATAPKPPSNTIKDSAIITSSSNTSAVVSAVQYNNNNGKSCNSTTQKFTTKTPTTNSISTNSNNTAANAATTSLIAPTAVTTNSNVCKNYFQIPSDILDDLASRFIINVPDMELSNLIRICFQIELAHWFYLDFFCAIEEKKLQPCGMKPFSMQIFQHIPFLREHLSTIDKILDDWKNYKLSVPTYGAILISEDLNYCLLVQSYFAKSSWGFPKGKVNETEDPVHCATREVYEETGYDITELIVPNDYIEAVINYQYTRLYIVRNVSLNTQFSPRTRNEIKCCDWFPIDSLPINKNDAISKTKLGLNANSFFMIMPFVKRLKKWVHDKRSGIETRRKFSSGTGATNGGGCGTQSTTTPTILSTSPVTTNNNGGANQKNSNNSCKKSNKQQQYNDDNNALNNGGGGAAGRSKRQRHKSMGDLDGIKLSNISNNSSNSNCKTSNIKNNHNNNGGTKNVTDHSSVNGCNTVSNPVNGVGNGGSNHKKNSAKSLAAGGNANGNANGAPKRQLFHSQSQNGTHNGEKIISSFEMIRKEKQQMKAVAQAEKCSKAQKQQNQQHGNNGGNARVRAKSQSDKMCAQQQQHQNNKNNNISNNNNSSCKQRLQKQQSMIITNSNSNTSTITTNNNNNNSTNNNNVRIITRFTPSPISGTGLIAVATAAAAAPPTKTATNSNIYSASPAMVAKPTPAAATRPRPASVSSQHIQAILSSTSSPPQQQLLLQRMASGTNLRILKRSNSQQTQQLQPHHQPLKFTPSFDSWTNFSFTKNFIANVFC